MRCGGVYLCFIRIVDTWIVDFGYVPINAVAVRKLTHLSGRYFKNVSFGKFKNIYTTYLQIYWSKLIDILQGFNHVTFNGAIKNMFLLMISKNTN